ncbi:MAG: tetratricopeptide repeat protein, partial [Planctomycetaceae bacterium]|nr:tetratricopeptide repeat protein [Planctomycetaceae bacterium]
GEIDLAINLYQKVLQATPLGGEDHVWIRYQIASCYRRMNKFDEASKILRQIAEGSDTNPIVVNARWWLDTIERKRKLVNSIAVLEQFIKRKSNEINDE